MAFLKIIKNTAWFKRYQVKYRRRREGKTDYQARRKMIRQDKHKYNSKKYRLIVRFTGTQCICQIAYATIRGDIIVAEASSKDLKHYGISAGLKNYAAGYCTGLLVARRCLKKFGLDDQFKGKEEADGEEYHIEDEENEERKPFKAILDVGYQSTTSGARLWSALKGAVDGGLHVPHNTKKFPGFKPAEDKGGEAEYDAEAHKERILGGHVKDYMESMEEEDPTKFEAHFSAFAKADMTAENLEEKYTSAHAAIRADPFAGKEKKESGVTWERKGAGKVVSSSGKAVPRHAKISLKARKAKVMTKIRKAMMAKADE